LYFQTIGQAPAGSQPRAPKTEVYIVLSYLEQANDRWSALLLFEATRAAAAAGRAAAPAGLSVLNARKTARDPVLMAEAWVRTHSIGRTGPHRPACEAATSATADAACLGCGNAARTVVRVCIGRLSVVAGTARARWCSPFATICWAEVLPVTAADADRALGPMLPSSARERWPFCVLRDSCRAALPDQLGSPSIGSGRWTGGSRRRPRLIRLATDG